MGHQLTTCIVDSSHENCWTMPGPGWMQSDRSGLVWPFQLHTPSHDLLSQLHRLFCFPWQSTPETSISVAFPGQSQSLLSTLLSCSNTQAQSSFLGSFSAPSPSSPSPMPHFPTYPPASCQDFWTLLPTGHQFSFPFTALSPASVFFSHNHHLPRRLWSVLFPSLTSVEPIPSLLVCLFSLFKPALPTSWTVSRISLSFNSFLFMYSLPSVPDPLATHLCGFCLQIRKIPPLSAQYCWDHRKPTPCSVLWPGAARDSSERWSSSEHLQPWAEACSATACSMSNPVTCWCWKIEACSVTLGTQWIGSLGSTRLWERLESAQGGPSLRRF